MKKAEYEKPILPAELDKILKSICEQYVTASELVEDENSHVAFFKDVIIEASEKHGYCQTATMHVKSMGIFPGNRDGGDIRRQRAQ